MSNLIIYFFFGNMCNSAILLFKLGSPPGQIGKYDIEIDRYDGARNIQDLVVYPLKYTHNNEARIRADLTRREGSTSA